MSIQDDRTPNYNLALPFGDNFLEDDVIRIRQALVALDTILQAKQAALGFTPENPANKGAAGGYAPLDGAGKVPAINLPSYVDDVVEVATSAALPATGEAGKIYVTLNDNKIFRWSGTVYIEISASPGTTDAITEGAVNQYFTAARALAAVPLASGSVAGRIKPGAGFNVSGDGTLTYTGGSGVTAFYTDIVLTISTNGQTAFAVAGGYTPGLLDLYLNGALLLSGDDYTATSGSSLTMATGVSTGDTLVARVWILVSIANAVAKTGGTMTGPLVLPGNAVNPLEAVPLQQMMCMVYYGSASVAVNGAEAWVQPTVIASAHAQTGPNLISIGQAFKFQPTKTGTCRLRGSITLNHTGGVAPTQLLLRQNNGGTNWPPELSFPIVSGTTGRIWFELAFNGVPPTDTYTLSVRLTGATSTTTATLLCHHMTHEFFMG